jgi:hypothetical protein
MWGSWPCLPSSASIYGTNCGRAWRASVRPKWAGARLCARIRRSPSAISILLGKTEAYQIFRYPEGGRKDVLRWTVQGEKPVAELEIYRSGGEFNQTGPTFAGIAARMPPAEARDPEPAGVIDSEFGAVTLLRYPGDADGAQSCLGLRPETNRIWRNYSPAPSPNAAAAPHRPHRPHQWTG